MQYDDIIQAHYERRKALGVERRGNVIGPRNALDKLPKRAFDVRDWQQYRSPRTQEATFGAIAREGLRYEMQFDAAHGRRYRLMVFAQEDRAAVLTFGTVNAENE